MTPLIEMRSREEARGGTGYPLQYSCLENPMYRGACWARKSPWSGKESAVTEHQWTVFVSLNIINYRCHQKMSGERPINGSDVKVSEIIRIILDTYLEMLRMFKAGEKQHMC